MTDYIASMRYNYFMKKFNILLFFALLLVSAISQAVDEKSHIISTVKVVKPFDHPIPWEIDLGEKGQCEAKLHIARNFIFVDININDQGPFRFLLDTGADSSIISSELIEKLKINSIEKKKKIFKGSHRKAEVDTALYIIEKMNLGEALLQHVPFIATNTALDDFQILQDLNIEGILGANLFYDIVLTLDMPQEKLILSHKDFDAQKGSALKFQDKFYLPVVKTKVVRKNDETEYNFLIDTGYNGYIKMPVCFPYDETARQDIVSYDVFNEPKSGFMSALDGTLIIADKTYENPMVKYSLGDCGTSEWGLIGSKYLKQQVISIDQQKRVVIFH